MKNMNESMIIIRRRVGGKEGGAHTITLCTAMAQARHAERNCVGPAASFLSLRIPQF